jgi:large subunit ribosomal protein L10
VIALADVAPREELLARLAGGIAAPMTNFARLLQAVPQKFAYALQALVDAGGAPGAPTGAVAAAEPSPEGGPTTVADPDDAEAAGAAEAEADESAAEELTKTNEEATAAEAGAVAGEDAGGEDTADDAEAAEE